MSVRVMSWVFEHSEATGNDRLVLLAIADRCDDDGGNCWKSTEKLAEKAKVSKRTAQRCVDHLVEMGELAVQERPGTTNMLSVLMEGRQVVTPSAGGQEQGGVNLSPLPLVTPRQPVTRDTAVQGGATPVSTDTSLSRPSSPQPPANGGRIREHCDKHTKFRRSCSRCDESDAAARAKPPWCGNCNPKTRIQEDEDGGVVLGRCPNCHPLRDHRKAS